MLDSDKKIYDNHIKLLYYRKTLSIQLQL